MANNCYQEFLFEVDDPNNEQDVANFQNFVEVLYSAATKSSECYKIPEEFGFTPDDCRQAGFNMRGTFLGTSYLASQVVDVRTESSYSFRIEIDSAWSPLYEMFVYIIAKKYTNDEEKPSITVDVFAEEPGCEIYINTRPDVWEDVYIFYDNGREENAYAQSLQELIDLYKDALSSRGLPEPDSLLTAKILSKEYCDGELFHYEFEEEY
jgi:hypothetical protein